MIEDELRTHYANQPTDPAATSRVLAAVIVPPSRRRVAPAAAAGLTVAAVAALAIGVTQLHGTHPGTPAAGALQSSSLAASETPSATISISTSADSSSAQPNGSDGPFAIAHPQWMLQMISSTLPGTTSGGSGKFVENTEVGGLVYNDGHGAARIDYSITWPSNAPKAAVPSGCKSAPSPGPDCTTLADGTQLDLSKGTDNGTKEWDASAYLTNGIQLQLMEWNAATPKGSPTRTDPPLSLEQLKALLTNCRWVSCPPQVGNTPSGVSTTAASPSG